MLADSADVVAGDDQRQAAGRGAVVDLHESPGGLSPRERLARDASEGYERLREAVFAAIDADKPHPVRCPNCEHKFQAKVPDHTARLKAVDLALSQGFGRAPEQAKQPEQAKAGPTESPLRRFSGEELKELIAGLRRHRIAEEPPRYADAASRAYRKYLIGLGYGSVPTENTNTN